MPQVLSSGSIQWLFDFFTLGMALGHESHDIQEVRTW
jgi:hypothetical protein